ncbi:PP2C family protein-serine/threonine phosphatase [Streptomyces sp. NPDC026672]|uniref:PP2C family protein-serine/threonine phosphatase n=1 Tax=unclassified Streptomyces TaxID=2593676 RepID=UPI00341041EE
MGLPWGVGALRQAWRPGQPSRALLLLPVAFIVLLAMLDLRLPEDIHLGPALVIAPALTASFAGPRTTALVGVLAVATQIAVAMLHGGLDTPNHVVQTVTLTVLSAMIVGYAAIRDRRRAQLARVRSVAEVAQTVLMRPLPERVGELRIASLYLAAEDEAQIGGDLYAATRADGAVRVLIGDVRGKGLPAVGEAALLLGAFREAAHRHTLPGLAVALEQSVSRHSADLGPPEEADERFTTALLVEIPDGEPVTRLTSCGHPPPLLIGPGHPVTVPAVHPSPPLGVHSTVPADYAVDEVAFPPGDTLLLYTDGVIEARDAHGRFYPLAERVARWSPLTPEALVQRLRHDLLAHCGGRLNDDAAVVAVHRAPARAHHHGRRTEDPDVRLER